MFTLVTKATKLVVSDNGDILSPKTAPAIIAPSPYPYRYSTDAQLISTQYHVEADPQASQLLNY